MDNLIRKTYQAVETKAIDDTRSLLVKISTSSPDRSRDIVFPKGAVLDNYLRNPVVALAHKYDGLSIAKTDDIQITDEGIVAKVTFPDKGIYPVADTVYELYKGGFMNAWSIGFIPIEMEEIDGGGMEFKKWELLEYSAVLVPDNPEALTLLRSKGIDTEPLEKVIKEIDDENEEVEPEKVEEKEDAEEPEVPEEKEEEQPVAEEVETKEGRVLSEKNIRLISSTISQMKSAIDALSELITAAEPTQDETDKSVQRLVVAVRQADKILGIALRDTKADGQLRIVREESRMPVAVGQEGVK